MTIRLLISCALSLLACAGTRLGAAQEALSPADLLSAYSNALDVERHWDIDAQSIVKTLRPQAAQAEEDLYLIAYRRDAANIDVLSILATPGGDGALVLDRNAWREIVVTGRAYILPLRDGSHLPCTYTEQNPDARIGDAMNRLEGGEALEGVLAHDGVRVDSLLRSATSLTSRIATIDGETCHVLSGIVAGRGTYTLWLSPQKNDALVRAEIVKTGDDRVASGSLSTLHDGPEKIVRFVYRLTGVTFDNAESTATPTAGAIEEVWELAGGGAITRHTDHVRKRIGHNPDFSSIEAFERALPASRILINADAVNTASIRRDASSVPGPSYPIAALAGALLLAGGMVYAFIRG